MNPNPYLIPLPSEQTLSALPNTAISPGIIKEMLAFDIPQKRLIRLYNLTYQFVRYCQRGLQLLPPEEIQRKATIIAEARSMPLHLLVYKVGLKAKYFPEYKSVFKYIVHTSTEDHTKYTADELTQVMEELSNA